VIITHDDGRFGSAFGSVPIAEIDPELAALPISMLSFGFP